MRLALNFAAVGARRGSTEKYVGSPCSFDRLSNRLRRLILDAQLRRRMGQQARLRAPGLSIETSVRNTLDAIVHLTGRRDA